jgi:hypothetical protein
MSDWNKLSKAFDFIEAVIPYLDEMASRGDYQAKMLHEQATTIEDEEEG